MTVSIVTISFNQARFIEQTINSVLSQDYRPIEYIVVDPGSTDGSRKIIERYSKSIDKVIFEPDDGPADGLRKGFEASTGNVLGFLNSDDLFLPGVITKAVRAIEEFPRTDAVYGHGFVVDENNLIRRRVYVDRFDRRRFALGCMTFIQPSLFFRREAYLQVGGFNPLNRTCWDAELLADFCLAGKVIRRFDEFVSAFRIHQSSISGSGQLQLQYHNDWEKIFQKISGRSSRWYDSIHRWEARVEKWILNPVGLKQHFVETVIPSYLRRKNTIT